MQILDSREFGDEFVIHFGGEFHRVNAYTFATSLIALADAIRAANYIVNPGYELEIVVEAIGPGSFKTKIRALQRGINNLFSAQTAREIVIGLIIAIIYEHTFSPDLKVNVVVNDNSVVITQGEREIIIPKDAEKYYQEVKRSEDVNANIAKAFGALEKDESVSEFGITKSFSDSKPTIVIPREQFPIISGDVTLDNQNSRQSVERTQVQIVRAILERSKRRWEFVWKGIKISAPVSDEDFYNDFFAHRITIAPGDSLDVDLKVVQKIVPDAGIYVNSEYEILKVYRHIPRMTQQKL